MSEQTTYNSALLGCPFCGGDAHYGENTDEGLEWIECSKCKACTTAMAPLMEDVKELLAEAWNQRHPNNSIIDTPESAGKAGE